MDAAGDSPLPTPAPPAAARRRAYRRCSTCRRARRDRPRCAAADRANRRSGRGRVQRRPPAQRQQRPARRNRPSATATTATPLAPAASASATRPRNCSASSRPKGAATPAAVPMTPRARPVFGGTTGHGRSIGARTDLTWATPAAERPRMRVRVAPPAASRNVRTARSAAAAAASGEVTPSHCVPDGVSMPSAISAPTASSATSARSAAMETAPPPSTSRPNFGRQRAADRSSAARPSAMARAMGRTSSDSAGSRPGQRRDHEIARRLGLGIGIEQAEPAERGVQLGQVLVQKAAQLQVGAPRQIDMAVAQPPGEVGQSARLIETEGAAERPDAHDQPVAALHRPQGARAPAFHLGGGGRVHDPAFMIARSSS